MLHYLPLPLLFALIVLVPRIGQLFRIPMPLAALAMGGLLSLCDMPPESAGAIEILSTVAITLLFLFAGLEVDLRDFAADWKRLAVLVAAQFVIVVAVWGLFVKVLTLPLGPAALFAVGILTPSAGYILDSLSSMTVPQQSRTFVRSAAIILEVESLLFLLFATKVETPFRFLGTVISLVAAGILIPFAWHGLRRTLFELVPRSEFVCLIVIAMLASYASKALGMYYIFGAFFTGLIIASLKAQKLDEESTRYIHAIELITVLVLPIYFFRAGLRIPLEIVTLQSLVVGLLLLAAIPIRGLPLLVARWASAASASPTGVVPAALALTPTLVFGLVMSEMLTANSAVPRWIPGALVTYTLLSTLVPSIFLRARPGEMDPYHEKEVVPESAPPAPVSPSGGAGPAPGAPPT